MKLDIIKVEPNKICSSKLKSEIPKYENFMNNFTTFHHDHCLKHGTLKSVVQSLPNTLQYVFGISLQYDGNSLFEFPLPCRNRSEA